MPRVGYELMAPVFARAKTLDGLHRAATVVGNSYKGTAYILKLLFKYLIILLK
jgi:hypothetical protein